MIVEDVQGGFGAGPKTEAMVCLRQRLAGIKVAGPLGQRVVLGHRVAREAQIVGNRPLALPKPETMNQFP